MEVDNVELFLVKRASRVSLVSKAHVYTPAAPCARSKTTRRKKEILEIVTAVRKSALKKVAIRTPRRAATAPLKLVC